MNKIKTIADLKLDINLIGCTSLEDFKKDLTENWGNNFNLNKKLIENFDRKVKEGNYRFSVLLINGNLPGYEQVTEIIQIKSQNYTLGSFIHLLYLKLSEKIDEYNDWHCFLEGFKRINDFEYEVILGS